LEREKSARFRPLLFTPMQKKLIPQKMKINKALRNVRRMKERKAVFVVFESGSNPVKRVTRDSTSSSVLIQRLSLIFYYYYYYLKRKKSG